MYFTETKEKVEDYSLVQVSTLILVCALDNINPKFPILYYTRVDFSFVTSFSSFPFPLQITAVSLADPPLRPLFCLSSCLSPQFLSFSYPEKLTIKTSFCKAKKTDKFS